MNEKTGRLNDSEIFSREFNVVVNSVNGDEGTYYIKGEVSIGGKTIPFNGVAFGRVGGHNISADFDDDAIKVLKAMDFQDVEIENLEVAIQVRLLQGEMVVKKTETRGVEE